MLQRNMSTILTTRTWLWYSVVQLNSILKTFFNNFLQRGILLLFKNCTDNVFKYTKFFLKFTISQRYSNISVNISKLSLTWRQEVLPVHFRNLIWMITVYFMLYKCTQALIRLRTPKLVTSGNYRPINK